ncbi:class 1 isoprenoid biosynthesis enzyme [Dactylosporangium sp. NPDC051484]|uniref:class 1 isoprenoid biosynthesis enzyme n=1 Tax=Dactylosporangium sp. NPDC051484 TaxID=3154942 RepID=UPI00344DFBC3
MVDVAEVVGAVEDDLTAILARLRASGDVADEAMAEFLGSFLGNLAARGSTGAVDVMIRLPLLVHAAETGDPAGGRLAALVHLLWWAAARYLDDLADGGPQIRADPARCNAGILAALGVGSHLPIRLVGEAGMPDATKVAALAELSRGWLDGISGQLLDYTARPAGATVASVLASYEGKTGAPYAMAAAMAACLAGADPGRVERWRDVGRRFGVLRQLTNDQRDLVTGRDEDIQNGAATFLVMLLLDGVPAAQRPALLELYASAATSAAARAEFKARLTAPEHLRDYHGRVDGMLAEVHGALRTLGGAHPYTAALHALVDNAMLAFPLPAAS